MKNLEAVAYVTCLVSVSAATVITCRLSNYLTIQGTENISFVNFKKHSLI